MEPRNIAPADGGKKGPKPSNNEGVLGSSKDITYIKAQRWMGELLVLMEAHVIVTPEQTDLHWRRVS